MGSGRGPGVCARLVFPRSAGSWKHKEHHSHVGPTPSEALVSCDRHMRAQRRNSSIQSSIIWEVSSAGMSNWSSRCSPARSVRRRRCLRRGGDCRDGRYSHPHSPCGGKAAVSRSSTPALAATPLEGAGQSCEVIAVVESDRRLACWIGSVSTHERECQPTDCSGQRPRCYVAPHSGLAHPGPKRHGTEL